jgi:hypothetical protein
MKPSTARIERILEKLEAMTPPPGPELLHVIVHEQRIRAETEKLTRVEQEKALAEHVAAHPEDAGRAVEDFRWIVHEFIAWPRPAGWPRFRPDALPPE